MTDRGARFAAVVVAGPARYGVRAVDHAGASAQDEAFGYGPGPGTLPHSPGAAQAFDNVRVAVIAVTSPGTSLEQLDTVTGGGSGATLAFRRRCRRGSQALQGPALGVSCGRP